MFDPVALFKSRLSAHLKLLNRYLRYIFNGHFMIALIFLIITLAVYYQRWLASLQETFPAAILIAIVLAFIVTYNPIQTFLKEPDKVFLLVKETKMKSYFLYTIIYNYVTQLYIVFLGIAVIAPLYGKFYSGHDRLYSLLIVVIILLAKIWNVNISFQKIRYRDQLYTFVEAIIRFGLHLALFYTVITGAYFLIVGLITIVYYNVIYFFQKKHTGIMWEQLIENDEQRLASFYRFVSLFADVPHAKSKLKKRRLLTKFIQKFTTMKQTNTYTYLFRLTFVRSGDYLPLFVRLTILGGVIIYFVPNSWLKVALAIAIVYMTSFQLMALYYEHRMNIWLDLYPIGNTQKEVAFLRIMKQLAFGQIALLAIVFLAIGNIEQFFIFLAISILIILLFVHTYVKNKLAKADGY